MPSLTDTHCHLNLNWFASDLSEVLLRAAAAGIERILIPGIDLPNSYQAVKMAEQHPAIYAAVGIHPNDANTWDSNTLPALEELAQHPKVVAIGEIGLDYYRQHSTPERQKNILEQQIILSLRVQKPIILHSRSALPETLTILQQWLPGIALTGVFHSYEGSLETAQSILNAGFYLGVSGPITFQNARERQKTFQQIPLKHLLLETDAPYLTPHPWRGQRNEPAHIPAIAQKLADLHQTSLEQVAIITSHNAHQLFQWGVSS